MEAACGKYGEDVLQVVFGAWQYFARQTFDDGTEEETTILFSLVTTLLLFLAEASLFDVKLLAAGLQLSTQC